MEPHARPVRARSGARLVAVFLVGVLLVTVLPGCKKEEPLPPVLQWLWSAKAPGAVSTVRACGIDGPTIIASADGTLRKTDGAGAIVWEVANPGLVIASVSADAAGSVVCAVTATPSGSKTPAPSILTVFDAVGTVLWQVASPAAGLPIGGRVSADGTKVLVFWPGSKDAPGNVNVRDSATGAVRWEKRTEGALSVACDATVDFRRVVTGYSLANGDKDPTGLAEAYADDSIRTHLELKAPVTASLITTGVVGLLDERGRLSAYELADDGMGARIWRKSTDRNGVMLAGNGQVVVATYDAKGKDDAVAVSTLRVYSAKGKSVYQEEFEGSARYIPTISADGRYLALLPVGATEGEVGLVVKLGEEPTTAELPPGVTAIHFGAGDGRMLVGLADGTYGVAKLPL